MMMKTRLRSLDSGSQSLAVNGSSGKCRLRTFKVSPFVKAASYFGFSLIIRMVSVASPGP